MSRILTWVVFVPVAVVLVALAVANRHPVPFTIDPFNPGNPGLTANLPLFVYMFAALVVGLVVGSIATWMRQSRYRRSARESQAEARALRERLLAETPAPVAHPGPALPPPSN